MGVRGARSTSVRLPLLAKPATPPIRAAQPVAEAHATPCPRARPCASSQCAAGAADRRWMATPLRRATTYNRSFGTMNRTSLRV